MAQVILSSVGQAVGGGIGRTIGSVVGGAIDQRVIGSLGPARQRGPRLETLRVQSSADGAPMACVFGRARVTGQVIWAARFLERKDEQGGKGGPRTVEYGYSLSFAVAVCEGAVDGIGRVWADGQPMHLAGVTMRVHRGTDDQMPDPLIEALEGAAPAYRGTAYVVFEDLPLGPYGNRPPQLSFEVFRRPEGDGLEEKLEGVCLIPGAGEFVLATEAVMRREGLTRTRAENLNHGEGRPDLIVSLDQLAVQLPNLKRVSLVIGWFGTDLRAGHCIVKPGVERRDKPTEPLSWSVAGLGRDAAHLISQVDGRPAYGGTPSDETVRQCVAALKARGWKVTLYPFVFMDVPTGNGLPDPYGGAEQAPHPWRGRLRGEDGPGAAAEVASLFGTADGWGLRRLARHYAALAAETGCDGLLIGSEMRGLTWTRDAAGGHPAVDQYRTLAAECRAIAGPRVSLSYAADWSEYFGHRPEDGTVTFHLDPLWADANVDYVGIDWYPPLGDWRGGDGGIDVEMFEGAADPAYLAAQVAGGDGFDWFYANGADRAAQVRTPIVDTAHGEDWVFRPKDLAGWWSNTHHDRPGGVRSAVPTAWVPGMKPIRLTEFGCAAVDRGGNAPNLFLDPKSSESFLPPYSTGARDDRMQRRAIEAVIDHYAVPQNNPVSAVYDGPMLEAMDAWCWDARPYPAFPALEDVWADARAWRTGHWLNGRLTGDTGDLLAAILRRGGLDEESFTIAAPRGQVSGYVIDRPMTTREAIEPLLRALALTTCERDGRVALVGAEPEMALATDDLALPDEGGSLVTDGVLEPMPGTARVRFIDAASDYQTGAVVVRGDGEAGAVDVDLPAVCEAGLAETLAGDLLRRAEAPDGLTVAMGPRLALAVEPGDRVTVPERDGVWRVERVSLDETPTMSLARVVEGALIDRAGEPRPGDAPPVTGEPFLAVMDLPARDGGAGPLVAVAADPWRPMTVHAGVSAEVLTARAEVVRSATVGVLTEALAAGPMHRWDAVNAIRVRLEGQAPQSRSLEAVLAGANAMAVCGADGWEVVQFREAALMPDGTWRLSDLLRGQQGTDAAMGAEIGALVVVLDAAVTAASLAGMERGVPLIWRAGPSGAVPGVGFRSLAAAVRGAVDRPWSPAHLKGETSADGVAVSWVPRATDHDMAWDLEPVERHPRRFRVRVLDGDVERRAVEVQGLDWLYPAAMVADDFPDGPGTSARLVVAQWGEAWGWGSQAAVPLV